MEDDKRSDRNLAKAEAARRLAHIQRGVFWLGTEHMLTRQRHYNLVFLHARRRPFPAFAEIAVALQEIWPWGEETLDQPDPTWLQWRRRLDKVEPFCRIAGHTSEEVRDILASLETVYRDLFPQINLRQWTSFIYTWLTQSHFDPTHSGRVTMDHLMKLVTTALEWTYEAHESDVRAEALEQAADLLVLRRDTFRIIDGDGPSYDVLPAEPARGVQASETKKNQEEQEQDEQAGSPDVQKAVSQPTKPVKCTFSGVVPIDLQQFLGSGVTLVECPDCTSTSALAPHNGILRFKSHNRRKTRSFSTESRWARREMNWGVVGK